MNRKSHNETGIVCGCLLKLYWSKWKDNFDRHFPLIIQLETGATIEVFKLHKDDAILVSINSCGVIVLLKCSYKIVCENNSKLWPCC